MSNWSAGYVADIGYTFGYYAELNPQHVKLAFLNQGLNFPEMNAACELGYGQGLSINLHASASTTDWFGTDFNPTQASFAQELGKLNEARAVVYDDSFEEFANRKNLPEFDYIGLHGIWSWISEENRKIILDFIKKKLKVGGVLYISYNTLPGWGAFAPMRDLMTNHVETFASSGDGIVSNIEGALNFAQKLIETKPAYATANPQIVERLKKMQENDRHYLAHEYFNRDWCPMSFTTMSKYMEGAKLQYACSAHYHDHIDTINLKPEQQSFIKSIPDKIFRETTRDFMVNQQFRRDYWVKGLRKLSPIERGEKLRAHKVILTTKRSDVSLKIQTMLGEANMSEAVYSPILDYLADHEIRNLGQIEQYVREKGVSFENIVQAAMILSGVGHLASVQDEADISKSRKSVEKINDYLCRNSIGRGDVNFLASNVTGGGVGVSRFHQLFLLSIKQGKRQPPEWALYVWEVLSAQGQKILKNGHTLQTQDENIDELTIQAVDFESNKLPILRALQIV
jgi:SAM-dependent methyltransferase